MTEGAGPSSEFGDYHLYEELGHGGIGETFVARLKRDAAAGFDRYFCLKIMGREFQAARGVRRQQAIDSLRHEARVVAGLNHPNIARLVDSGSYNDVWFLAFELVRGANLDEILAMRRFGEGLEPEHVRRIGIQVAAALQCAHAHDVLHRDVKPSNILIGTDGCVKLVDFGLAKANAQASADFTVGVGTPRYWAPEQFLQTSLTAATDLYALGVVLYELLTTTHPSHADTPEEFRRNIVRGVRRPLQDFGVPDDLAMIIDCCLANDPEERFLSAAALHAALSSSTKVSGFEYEIGEIANAARDGAADRKLAVEHASLATPDHGNDPTVHTTNEQPTRHMPAFDVAAQVRDGIPDEMLFYKRDEIISDLSRMARDAIRQRDSRTQPRRRRSTTVAEILPAGEAPPLSTEPPTAAESVRARKREETRAEVAYAPPPALETVLEVAMDTLTAPQAPATVPEVTILPGPALRAARPSRATVARTRVRSWIYGVSSAVVAAVALIAFQMRSPQISVRSADIPLSRPSTPSARLPAGVEAKKPAAATPAVAAPPPATLITPASKSTPTDTARATKLTADETHQSATRSRGGASSQPGAPTVRVTLGLIPYGEVRVDGKRFAKAPFNVDLTLGKHRVVGRTGAGRSRSMTINVTENSKSFVLDLRDEKPSL